MSEIERHEVDTCGDMEPVPDGYWVRYEDPLAASGLQKQEGREG